MWHALFSPALLIGRIWGAHFLDARRQWSLGRSSLICGVYRAWVTGDSGIVADSAEFSWQRHNVALSPHGPAFNLPCKTLVPTSPNQPLYYYVNSFPPPPHFGTTILDEGDFVRGWFLSRRDFLFLWHAFLTANNIGKWRSNLKSKLDYKKYTRGWVNYFFINR